MTWPQTNTLVKDELKITYSFLPLTFHHAVWVPHRLVPFILDSCYVYPLTCNLYPYIEFCFENLDYILNSYGKSQDDLIFEWASKVAVKFNIDV